MKRLLPLLALFPALAFGQGTIVDFERLHENGINETYTAAAASNRAVVVITGGEDCEEPFNPTLGGVAFVDAGLDPESDNDATDRQVYVG